METGKVKWYSEIKGYGFIETEDGKDLFVHRNGLQSKFGGLQENQKVEFETKQGDKGPYADNVRKID